MAALFLSGKEQQPTSCSKNNLEDTVLGLNCFGYEVSKTAQSRDSQGNHYVLPTQDDGCKLVLGLGPTPSSYCDYSIGMDKSKNSTTIFSQQLVSEPDSGMLKLGLSGGIEDVSVSVSIHTDPIPSYVQNQSLANKKRLLIPIVDEGSTSAKKKFGGYMPSLLLAPRLESNSNTIVLETQELFEIRTSAPSHPHHIQLSPDPLVDMEYSAGTSSDHRNAHHPKKCRFKGCSKGARGASGLCIAHGGGQRCQKQGCNKGAESRTAYCKAHGGGRRCQRLGCTKSAEGKTDHCIAHGGGRRCMHQAGCTKAARGKSGLCIRHGGGKRCKIEGCTRSAEGQAGLCISHGGGRRCHHPGCIKGAQGSTMFCKAHGGGKRCIFVGCTKGAEGSTPLCKGHGGGKRCLFEGGGICPKSVHGGTDYCVAHGGGKRCAVPGCGKSARGRTDCCVRHGGGKRCKIEGCGKSAQGSTDFCKAHGGGKRCAWRGVSGDGVCEKFARGKSGLCAAHGNMASSVNNMIGPDLFRNIVSLSAIGSSLDNDYSSGVSAVSDCAESSENTGRKQMIPPQVLVPSSMKKFSSSTSSSPAGGGNNSFSFVVPEGRVHGGGLMSLFGGDLKNADVDG
eukprot:TRINITY_DN1714_c0_g2_i2.p1 TRINITY_DN1714_c0_g2~~TRINITY_DN1714_c0_g2_i2.p1  ORF type:complete len:618 (+),score=71.67 TRINITY_DN1714_c0_g2_i2:561-2414(+)